ncbi:2-hydroxyacid dehydrogenase [Sphingomonas nostoxanthinifaciens]|uniref:2-hydroxyacid dehydrogenase n=1 Tax=Sphingomonas nostoxanthinifaciens TaxID=2872652 RepID=UPI001CC1E199|nr:glyoxylate/hydroxypyruvate reductase A [Sphingomonas nostoxanthinifaciens]UAK23780.1 glyoxylate/hydroxypyruvate reductase A [Sphingomonas nostoxanthinifaciens]
MNRMPRILIAARTNPEGFATLFRAELPEHEVVTAVPDDGAPTPYVVVGLPPPGLLASLKGLEVILSINAGVEHLLASGEVPPGVPVVRMVDPGLVAGMVEWVAGRVLAWHRNLFAYREQQAGGLWAQLPEMLAAERIVTVLGAGELGGPVATMLATLGFAVRTWSRTPRVVPGCSGFAGRDALGDAVAGADVLVNLLPATAQTIDLIDHRLLSRMRPGSLLVNGGRGSAVVDADLLRALDDGVLGAAALDVFRQEPLPGDHPFWSHPRVFITPHAAAITHARTSVAVMAESIRRHERGEPLANVVDPARGY